MDWRLRLALCYPVACLCCFGMVYVGLESQASVRAMGAEAVAGAFLLEQPGFGMQFATMASHLHGYGYVAPGVAVNKHHQVFYRSHGLAREYFLTERCHRTASGQIMCYSPDMFVHLTRMSIDRVTILSQTGNTAKVQSA